MIGSLLQVESVSLLLSARHRQKAGRLIFLYIK